jgi:hypothetical protein
MKKRTIALERDAKVFGRDLVAARLFDRTTGLVHEGGLNALPAVSQVFKFVVRGSF